MAEAFAGDVAFEEVNWEVLAEVDGGDDATLVGLEVGVGDIVDTVGLSNGMHFQAVNCFGRGVMPRFGEVVLGHVGVSRGVLRWTL